jgi:hypothetical protein
MLTEQMATGRDVTDKSPDEELRLDWKMDPVLELWVDVQQSPAVVRLAGVLDGRTALNASAVVRQLFDEGYRCVMLDIAALHITEEGMAALVALEGSFERSGGELRWSGGIGPGRRRAPPV